MNKKYLVYRISDGLCVNCIVWDEVSPYTPDEGTALEITPVGSFASIGWTRKAEGDWEQPVVEETLEKPQE